MKKFIMLMGLIMGIFFTNLMGADNSLEKIKEKKQFIVGLDDTYAPMGFRDEKGEIVGFDIDLAKEVAKRMGVTAIFKPCEWDGIIFDLKSKKIDLVWNGLGITEERKKQIGFSKSYFQGGQIIITRVNTNIQNLNDLKGKTLGVQLGSISLNALEKTSVFNSIKKIIKYGDNVEALLDLEAGRIDAVVLGSEVGQYYLTKNKKSEFKILDEKVEDKGAGVGVGMRIEDTTLINEVDRLLDEMKKDGTFALIAKKWFGENYKN